jgi:CRP-like cAMP-binding protein
MVSANFIPSSLPYSSIRAFKRREMLQPRESSLWQIETGAIRTFTLDQNGTIITLGFWGTGDIVGQALSRVQPYQVECLTDVTVRCLKPDQFWQFESAYGWHINQVMLEHIHQMQELLRIRSGQIPQRLQQFLEWMADKFGRHTEQGQLIELWLTHQDIADAIGTTRVTVTRLLNQFEQTGLINLSHQKYILLCL